MFYAGLGQSEFYESRLKANLRGKGRENGFRNSNKLKIQYPPKMFEHAPYIACFNTGSYVSVFSLRTEFLK